MTNTGRMPGHVKNVISSWLDLLCRQIVVKLIGNGI
jgi:hypothetical protein